jgi:hypothetical protein
LYKVTSELKDYLRESDFFGPVFGVPEFFLTVRARRRIYGARGIPAPANLMTLI